MSPTDQKRIARLMKLAEASIEFEHVDIDLVSHFHYVREDIGLAKLLMLVQEYVINKSRSNSPTPTPPTQNQIHV